MPYITHALQSVLTQRGLSTEGLAELCGVAQSTISRTMHGRRVHTDTLRALCTQLPEDADGLDILIAHLRDEIDRAGRLQTEIRIEADAHDHEEDIRLLASESQVDADLRAILHDLARLVRRGRIRLPEKKVAEDPTPYAE